MSAINEIVSFAGSAARTAASAVKNVADGVLANFSVSDEEAKIKEAYIAIGKLFYQNKTAGTIPDGPAYDELVAKINSSLAKIEELKKAKDSTPESTEE